jgi:hypothetical protein
MLPGWDENIAVYDYVGDSMLFGLLREGDVCVDDCLDMET